MQEKVIATRQQFLDWDKLIRGAKPSSETSVEYREALYIFMDKVDRYIRKPASEIFKLDDATQLGIKAYNDEIYKEGLAYAEAPPLIEGGQYAISRDKLGDWIKKTKEIEGRFAEVLGKQAKNDADFKEWCAKKVQLTIEKIELSKMPSLDANSFYEIARAICTESQKDDDDGKEVE